MHRLYANTMPFYMTDLNICEFWCWGIWWEGTIYKKSDFVQIATVKGKRWYPWILIHIPRVRYISVYPLNQTNKHTCVTRLLLVLCAWGEGRPVIPFCRLPVTPEKHTHIMFTYHSLLTTSPNASWPLLSEPVGLPENPSFFPNCASPDRCSISRTPSPALRS